MHDMFIQSQQLATNSSTSNYGWIPKKRKAEHYNNNNGDLTHVEQVFNAICGGHTNSNQSQNTSTTTSNSSTTNLNNASPNGNQQPFVRASTIKLLDTYQRCGQKVGMK